MSRFTGFIYRKARFFALFGATFLVLGLGGLAWSARPTESFSDEFTPFALPSIELPDLQTDSLVDVGDLVGKPTVINFFFSDCVGCVTEMPMLERTFQKFGDSVRFLGVNHLEKRALGRDIVRKTGVTYQVVWDKEGKVAPAAGVLAFPATLFLDAHGVVQKRHLGVITSQELERQLDSMTHRIP